MRRKRSPIALLVLSGHIRRRSCGADTASASTGLRSRKTRAIQARSTIGFTSPIQRLAMGVRL